jgi:murein DD-endopeptidase MepM/ murein hydrolase activator NlpD
MRNLSFVVLAAAALSFIFLPDIVLGRNHSKGSTCFPHLPEPELVVIGSENYEISGQQFTLFLLNITNSDKFPNALFDAAPTLPACGANTNSSRTWLRIFDENGTYIYGFCALTDSDQFNGTSFAIPLGSLPPSRIYITLEDRLCNITYTSNYAPVQESIKLEFPLNRTPETAYITSYFDHSMSRPYSADGTIVTYLGESASGKKCTGGFTYNAPEACSYGGLSYDGHPGYDFRTKDQNPDGIIDVFAAAEGDVEWGSISWNTIYINHPSGYRTSYLHLSERLASPGDHVLAGDVIGKGGSQGSPGNPHLHFQVEKRVGTKWIPVDPYGWQGCLGCDPYGTPSPRLWE